MGCSSSKLLQESEAKAVELQAMLTELEDKVALAEKGLAAAMGRASQAEAKVTQVEEKAKEVKAPEKAAAEAVSQENIIEHKSLQLESVYKAWQKEACALAFDECGALFEDVEDAQKVKCTEAMHCDQLLQGSDPRPSRRRLRGSLLRRRLWQLQLPRDQG